MGDATDGRADLDMPDLWTGAGWSAAASDDAAVAAALASWLDADDLAIFASGDDPDAGNSGQQVVNIAATGNQDIDGILVGKGWSGTFNPKLTITISYPTVKESYGASQGTGVGQYPGAYPFTGFAEFNTQEKIEAARGLTLIGQYANLTFPAPLAEATTQAGAPHATIRFGNSGVSGMTSIAAFPNAGVDGGDIFLGPSASNPVMGSYASGGALLHEIGHALGLKHGHETGVYGALPAAHNDIEYSIMTYYVYIGSDADFQADPLHRPIGPIMYPTTYMMDDIAALQDMYGASYARLGQARTYKWSITSGELKIDGVSQGGAPNSNHIFMTVWTGGADATYDLSNYNTNGLLDLRPGKGLLFSESQRVDLGYTPDPGHHFAQYNVYNSYNYNGNTSSEIGHLIAGGGNNTIYGNDLHDTITVGLGNNTIYAGQGGVTVSTGGGDNVVFGGAGLLPFLGATNIATFTDGSNLFFGGSNSLLNLATATGLGVNSFYGGAYSSNYLIGGTNRSIMTGGYGGVNQIYGEGEGNDTLIGGQQATNVIVETGHGFAQIYGGDGGSNYLVGGSNGAAITGGLSALNSLYGESQYDNDVIIGGSGFLSLLPPVFVSNVLVEQGAGSAQLWGGDYALNYAVGGTGDDLLVGGLITNYLFGGDGNDAIVANGTSYIFPGAGNDFIYTNKLDSQTTGYVYEGLGSGVDTIVDFTAGSGDNHDVLVISAGTNVHSFADVIDHATQAGVYTVISLSATDQVYLYNVTPFQLSANDFIFT